MLVVSPGEAGGQADAAGNRIQFGDDHSVSGRDDVGADDGRNQRPKPVHAAVGNERLRFPLVEIGGHPARLDSFDALLIEPVQGSVEGQKILPQVLKEREVRGRDTEWNRRNAKAGDRRSGIAFLLRGSDAYETGSNQLVTDGETAAAGLVGAQGFDGMFGKCQGHVLDAGGSTARPARSDSRWRKS